MDAPPVRCERRHGVRWQLVKAVGGTDLEGARVDQRHTRAVYRTSPVMTDDEGGGADVVGGHGQSPRRLTHQSVRFGQRGATLRGWVPNEDTQRRGHVNIGADDHNVLNDICWQAFGNGDGIHPVVGGVVPASNATVCSDVEHTRAVGKTVHDVGRQTGDESPVPELVGVWIEHLNAGRASSFTGEANHKLAVVGVHRVELCVE